MLVLDAFLVESKNFLPLMLGSHYPRIPESLDCQLFGDEFSCHGKLSLSYRRHWLFD